MKFQIYRSSDYGGQRKDQKPYEKAEWDGRGWYCRFETLDELMAFVRGLDNHDIVLGNNHIEIYDNYRE